MGDSLAPGFLIAFPHLADTNFRQSVVLLLRQDEDGAMGVVVNHESPLLLRELCQDHEIPYRGDSRKRVRKGGPVQPEQGLVIYGEEHVDPEGQPIVEGLHISASRGTLARLCKLERGRFQCFSGYAGWAPGQLEHEIRQGVWVVCPADPSSVLDARPDRVWEHTLRSLGIEPASLVPGSGAEA
jgi:putative transcriptional regulator